MTRLRFTLGERYHTFLKGHRIMVHIQSSWFPMFDRNPQRFVDIYHARESDYQKATQTVYRSATAASCIKLPVVIPAAAGLPIVTMVLRERHSPRVNHPG